MGAFIIPSEMFDDRLYTKNFWLANEVDVVMISYGYIQRKHPELVALIVNAIEEGKNYINVYGIIEGYRELSWD